MILPTKMTSLSMNDNVPIVTIKENNDGTFVLEWDDTDPRCAEINTWTEEEWIEAIEEGLALIDITE